MRNVYNVSGNTRLSLRLASSKHHVRSPNAMAWHILWYVRLGQSDLGDSVAQDLPPGDNGLLSPHENITDVIGDMSSPRNGFELRA